MLILARMSMMQVVKRESAMQLSSLWTAAARAVLYLLSHVAMSAWVRAASAARAMKTLASMALGGGTYEHEGRGRGREGERTRKSPKCNARIVPG